MDGDAAEAYGEVRSSVFISYASESHARAKRLYEALGGDPKPYLFTELDGNRILADDALEALLSERLKHSQALLVLLDSHHVAAEWCGWEVATFRRQHGADAKLYYLACDHTPQLHEGPFRPWQTRDLPNPSSGMPVGLQALGWRQFLLDPVTWSKSRGKPAVGYRLGGRSRPAIRHERADRYLLSLISGACSWVPLLLLQLAVVGVAAEAARRLGLVGWPRQLGLIVGVVSVATPILAVVHDVVAACTAGMFASCAAIATTWISAALGDGVCDSTLAGATAAGVFVAAAASVREAQRAHDSEAPSTPCYIPVGLGLLSCLISLAAVASIFTLASQKAEEALIERGMRGEQPLPLSLADLLEAMRVGSVGQSIPLIWGMVVGGIGAGMAFRSYRRRRAALGIAAAGSPLVGMSAWLLISSLLGWLLSRHSPSIGTSVGLFAGTLGALVVGRARSTTARGRERWQRAILPMTLVQLVLTAIGAWTATANGETGSASYGLQMGALVALLLVATYGLHGAIWSWAIRAGDDARAGVITVLLVLPVVGKAIVEGTHALGMSTESPEFRRALTTLYLALAITLLVAWAHKRWLRAWLNRIDEQMSKGLQMSLCIHFAFLLLLLQPPSHQPPPPSTIDITLPTQRETLGTRPVASKAGAAAGGQAPTRGSEGEPRSEPPPSDWKSYCAIHAQECAENIRRRDKAQAVAKAASDQAKEADEQAKEQLSKHPDDATIQLAAKSAEDARKRAERATRDSHHDVPTTAEAAAVKASQAAADAVGSAKKARRAGWHRDHPGAGGVGGGGLLDVVAHGDGHYTVHVAPDARVVFSASYEAGGSSNNVQIAGPASAVISKAGTKSLDGGSGDYDVKGAAGKCNERHPRLTGSANARSLGFEDAGDGDCDEPRLSVSASES